MFLQPKITFRLRKMMFWLRKMMFRLRKIMFWLRKMTFWIRKIMVWLRKIMFWNRKIMFWNGAPDRTRLSPQGRDFPESPPPECLPPRWPGIPLRNVSDASPGPAGMPRRKAAAPGKHQRRESHSARKASAPRNP